MTGPLCRRPSRTPPARLHALLSSVTTLAATAAAAVLLLAGCASPGTVPAHPAPADAAALGAAASASEAWPRDTWWQALGDAELDRLVQQALARQPSLAMAAARLRQADAAVAGAGAAAQPQAQLSADLTDQRFTRNGMVPAPLAGSTRWNNSVQLGASWDLDLFGRQRAALDAAIGQQRATQADAQAARVLLAGQVVGRYVQLARLLDTHRLASQALMQRQQVLALVQQRLAAGLDTRVELRQAEGLLAQTRVDIEALAEQAQRERQALAELCGLGPLALNGLQPQLAALQPLTLPQALPADLLGRRADLVAQRWRVQAALRDEDRARAQFYPDINLVAFVGLSSLGLDRLIDAGARTAGVGPALRLPVFDGGRLRAQLGARAAEVDAAIAGYDASLLRALREVADELATLQSLQRQQAAQAQATLAAEQAFDLAVQRYRAGLGTFLTVLTAEGNVLSQRRGSSDLRARQLAAEAALTRALGGGWPPDATSPPAWPAPARAEALPAGQATPTPTPAVTGPALVGTPVPTPVPIATPAARAS